MERRTLRRARLALVVAIALVVIGAGALWRSRHLGDGSTEIPRNVRAPDGQRVRVQVLNGTKTRGLARRATMLLRDRGFDVLETGNGGEARDTSVVYDLTGHPEWAARVAKLFPPARVETRPDSSRYLDIVVVIGAAWRPPTEPFHP
jgi:hypothetical protein